MPLKIRASDVSKLCGIHPWADVPALFTELLYQGLPQLLNSDVAALGIVLLNEEEEIDSLLAQAGASTRKAMRAAAVAKPGDVNAAAAVKTAVDETIASSTTLTEADRATLKKRARHLVNTNFGTSHEDNALKLYETQTGCPVRLCNERTYVWPFPRDRRQLRSPRYLHQPHQPPSPPALLSRGIGVSLSDAQRAAVADVVTAGTAAHAPPAVESLPPPPPPPEGEQPILSGDGFAVLRQGRGVLVSGLGALDRRWLHGLAEELGCRHLSCDSPSTGGRNILIEAASFWPTSSAWPSSSSSSSLSEDQSEPLFVVLGKVDGVSDELFGEGDDPMAWAAMRPVVVEVSRIASSFLWC